MFEIVMGIDDFLIQLVKYWSQRIWLSARHLKLLCFSLPSTLLMSR